VKRPSIPATTGKVFYKGRDVTSLRGRDWRALRKDVQLVFQDPYSALNPKQPIGDSIAEPLIVHRVARGAELDRKVRSLLDLVGLPASAARKYPHAFSGGQRQRIVIARALALRLFLRAALVALVLGAGTLLANAYVVIRRRAYELAALRAIGAPRSVLIKSARREQVTLALTGLALGAASGLVAAGFALPSLLDAAGGDGPPLWYGPAWAPVAVLVVSVLVLLVVVADVGARRTVRRALPELLRQVQE